MALPIRTRLTVWYSGALLVVLLAFGAGVYFTFQASLQASLDRDLQDRLQGVEAYMQRELQRFPKTRLWHELEESVQLRPGGEMMQISDSEGTWIFQSQSIQGLRLSAPPANPPSAFETRVLRGVTVRVRTAVARVNGEDYTIQLATNLGPAWDALNRLVRAMLIFIPPLVVAAYAGGYWLSRRALEPVDQIIQDSRSIGHSNLSRRLMVPQTGDELQRLSETLNEMIDRLDAAFERVTRFTADASHELRSPVAFIRTTAEFALLQPRDAAVYRSAMADMHGEAERMTELIEDLLTLARADSGASEFSMSSLDLRDPLQQACAQAAACASCKGIRFAAQVPDRAIPVHGDFAALRRLFLIIIDNAIKYTPAAGRVDIQLSAMDAAAVVKVRDSGIGIAEDELSRIFERFYRSDKARQRESGGSGLGLSIARCIADGHGAQIEVESKLGAGSSFFVRIAQAS